MIIPSGVGEGCVGVGVCVCGMGVGGGGGGGGGGVGGVGGWGGGVPGWGGGGGGVGGYMEHGLEYITFYVQEQMAHLAVCSGLLLARDGSLGAPAFVRFAY